MQQLGLREQGGGPQLAQVRRRLGVLLLSQGRRGGGAGGPGGRLRRLLLHLGVVPRRGGVPPQAVEGGVLVQDAQEVGTAQGEAVVCEPRLGGIAAPGVELLLGGEQGVAV